MEASWAHKMMVTVAPMAVILVIRVVVVVAVFVTAASVQACAKGPPLLRTAGLWANEVGG